MTQPTRQPFVGALTYVDHPEIAETFVDFIEKIWADGTVVRIEFVVKRLDPPVPTGPQTAQKHTACRLVLSVTALPTLIGQLNGFMKGLMQQTVMQSLPVTSTQKPN